MQFSVQEQHIVDLSYYAISKEDKSADVAELVLLYLDVMSHKSHEAIQRLVVRRMATTRIPYPEAHKKWKKVLDRVNFILNEPEKFTLEMRMKKRAAESDEWPERPTVNRNVEIEED